MKTNLKNKIISVILVAVSAFALTWRGTSAEVAKTIDVTAYIANKADKEMANGEYDVRFALYSADRTTPDAYPSTSDPRIWEETQKIQVRDGILHAELGSANPIPDNVDFNSQDYYLGIRIATDSEMVPRRKLGAVPRALSALNSTNADTATNALSLQGANVGTKSGDIPRLGSGGKIASSMLPSFTKLGTITAGVWQGTAIANNYIAKSLTGKTYNGLSLTVSGGDFSIAGGSSKLTVSGQVSVNQNLTTSSTPTFAGLKLTSGLDLGTGDITLSTVNGNFIAGGNIIPDTDDAYNLGSSTKRWKNVYFSGSISSTSFNGNTIVPGSGKIDLNSHTLTLTADSHINQDLLTTSDPTFAGMTIGSLSGVLKAAGGTISGSATTSDLPEGSNLYYTNTRFDNRLAAKTTADLTEGANLYYTDARFDNRLAIKTTDNLSEGSSNLYYTTGRFDTRFAAKTTSDLTEGSNLYFTDLRARASLTSSATGLTYSNTSGIFTITSGYVIPTTTQESQWGTAYAYRVESAAGTAPLNLALSGNALTGSIDDATLTAKGVASFNSTNFSVASGAVNTIQDIATASTPSFSGLNLTNALTAGNGGTGFASYAAGDMLYAASSSAFSKLPIGTNGQVLVISSGVPAWVDSATGTSHDLLSASHSDTTPGSVERGAIITGQGTTPKWAKLTAGLSGQALIIDANGDPVWTTVTVGGDGQGVSADSLDFTEFKDAMALDANLSISASANNYSMDFDSGTLFIDTANNYVGIGTTAPGTKLDVAGAITATGGTSTNWNSAYAYRIESASGTLPLTLTLSGNGLTGSIADATTGSKGVASFNGSNFTVTNGSVNTIQNISVTATPTFAGLTLDTMNGVLKASSGIVSGSATTTDLTEGTNLYYTDVRARISISSTATGLTYNNTNGIFTLTSNYVIPTTTEESHWETAYGNRVDTWNAPLAFSSNIASLSYISTNLRINGTSLDTIQDIATASTPSFSGLNLTNALTAGNGGTGFASYAAGDMLYAASSSAFSKLPIGTNGQVLVISSGVPAWVDTATGAAHDLLSASHSDTYPEAVQRGDMITGQDVSSANKWKRLAAGGLGQFLSIDSNGDVFWKSVSVGDGIGVTPDSLDFSELKDAMALDADLSVSASTNNYSVNFDDGTLYIDTANNRVGIGTTAPGAKLSFYKSLGDKIRLYDGGGTSNYGIGIQDVETQFYVESTAHFSFNSGGSLQASGVNEVMRIMASGNVGIGTTAPAQALDVVGAIRSSNQLISTVSTGTAPLSVASTTLVTNLNAQYLNGQLGSYYLPSANVSGTATYMAKFTSGNTIGNSIVYDNGTNVGVGTTNPGTALDVVGAIRSSGQLMSTVAIGTAPLSVVSTTLVTNLNAQYLNGQQGSYYMPSTTDSWVNTIGDTMTGSLVFSGISNDITTNGAEHLSLMPGGNVGIGTTSPDAKLEVAGGIIGTTFNGVGISGTGSIALGSYALTVSNNAAINQSLRTIDTPTFAGLSLYGQLTSSVSTGTAPFSIASTTLVSNLNADLLDGQHGSYYAAASSVSGISGYIPKFTGSGTIGNSVMYTDGTNVGIGTTAPAYKMEVAGTLGITNPLSSTWVPAMYANAPNLANGQNYFISVGKSATAFNNASLNYHHAGDGSASNYGSLGMNSRSDILVFNASGYVGIGTTAPGSQLEIYQSSAQRLLLSGANINLASSNTITPLVVVNGTGGATLLQLQENGGTLFMVTSSGNVGIGTTNPTQSLDVVGKIAISGTQMIYNANAAGFTGSLFFGNGGGSLSHTTGSEGYYNTGVGYSSLLSNNTGHDNSALGVNALISNNTGYNNTALGVSALYSNTTGYNNSALGVNAGRFISGGSVANVTSNSSLYLGNTTMALADGDTNEIVIGASATGIGSNSVVLGNDSITKTILKGNVGIGTTAPGAILDVLTSNNSQMVVHKTGFEYGNTGILFGASSTVNASIKGGIIFNYPSGSGFGIGDMHIALNNAATTSNVTMADAILTIKSSGNVGIGTTAPTQALDVAGNISLSGSLVMGGNTVIDSGGGWLRTYGSTGWYSGTYGGGWYMSDSSWIRNFGSKPLYMNGDGTYSGVFMNGNVGIGTTAPGAKLSFYKSLGDKIRLYDGGGTSNYGIGIQDVETQFYVQSTAHFSFNSGGSLQASGVNEVMRIMASGNVGIGTTAPGYKLDVAGSVIVSAGLRVGSASGNSYVGFVSGAGADSSAAGGSIYTASFSNPLYILTGNVGIGTTAPGSKLEVNGGIAATTFNGVGISGTGSLALGSYTLTVSNNAAINQNLRIIDAPTFAGVSLYGQLTSSVSTGTAPLSIASTTLVSNLNADLLDGQHGSYYAAASSVSGTSGYIPKFTGSGTIGNSVMYTDGTNVGIGTTAPGAKLDVVSVDNTPSTIAMRILSLNGTAGLQFGYSSISQKQTTNNINIDAGLSSGNIILQSSSSGNVGIGTTAPASLLSLSDTAVSTYNDALTILNPNSLVHSGSSILMNSGTTNGVRLYSELMNATVGSEKTSFNIQNYMNGTWIDRLMVRFDGNVGIGTTAPSYALDVSGAVRASGEVISTSNNSYRLIVGNYGTFLRSDGSYTYFLTTASGDQYGTFSALRPFTFSNSTGVVSMGNGFTASGGAISLNASSNYAVSIATGTSTGAVTIGGGLNTVAIDSSDWDITTAGAMTGISGISSNGSYTQTGTSANTFTGISTFSNATYSALFTGGNVGIGTTNPLQPLDIYRAPSDTPGSGSLGFSFASGTDGFGVRLSATGGPYDLNIDRYAGSTWVPALTLARTTGYLGIGTTAPTQALEVNGMLYLNNRQADGGDLILASSGYSSWSIDNSSGRLRHFYYTEEMASFYNNGGLSIGQSYSNVTPPGNGLLVQGGVGIGTTAPTYKLDVVGTVRTSGQFISSAVTGTAPLSVASTTLVSNLNVDLLDGQHGSYYAAASSISGTSGYIPKFTGSGTIGNSLIYNTGTYVGIGTTSPNYPLDIQSATKMNSKTGYLTNGADYAEYFYTDDTDLSPGETVCVDTLKSNAVKRCDRSGDNNVMGIVSTSPSIVGNGNGIKRENDPHYKIIGMIGQVPAKVSNDNGSISIGDSLTASSTAGVLRKADAGESTVGVAMQDFNSSKGTIQVLISRRNQSLTVEKVEESVEQNIADMNIQDQITKMVATAQDSLQQQLADNDSKLSEINSQLTINGERIESIDSTMKDLEKQIDTIKEQNQAIIDFSSALNIQSLVYKDVDGNLDLMEGKLEAAGIVAGAFTVKIVDTANKTIGEAYFCPAEKKYDNDKKDCESTSDSYYDGTKVKVMTGAVTSSAKIFTSFEGNPGSSSWIDKNSSDGNFEIKLAAPVAEKTKVNWWIVEEGK